jgi:hypothetical protein
LPSQAESAAMPESSSESPDMMEVVVKGDCSAEGLSDDEFEADNRDWRSDLFFWSPGGNCPR